MGFDQSLSLVDQVEGPHYLEGQPVLDGSQFKAGRDGLGLGDIQPGPVAAAIKKTVTELDGVVEIVRPAGMIEVDGLIELVLVQDIADGV